MTDEGLLLTAPGASSEGNNAAKLLTFFGVPWRTLTIEEFFAQNGAGYEGSSKSRLVCSSDIFLRLIEDLERNPEYVRAWDNRLHSAFVYAGDDSEILRKLVSRLTRDDGAAIHETNSRAGDLVVSDRLNDFCGVMAGLRVAASKADLDTRLILNTPKADAINIISLGYGATFLKLEYKGVALFLSTFREIIDIDAALTSQNFDVRHHFLSAVPLVLYVKWAFAETCWSAPETNACLVIDDPVLKPRHGFVSFQELLSLMKRHKFTTNIAFIPWNWRRSAPETARLFRENPGNYSVSVHGCDHTRAEFGSSDQQRLYSKAQKALERMDRHESITGIRHDRVMVFPQGIFSEAAMSALKHTDLIAAVNNDVICADPHSRAITVSDVWDIAVMRYSNFPLFTRRYPWEGIENFAFDALLGKPVIIIIHHDYCSDHCARLVNFIQRLNTLQCAPTWRGLGEVVRRSCRQREVSPGEVEVEMYGTELRIKNCSGQPKRYLIRRRESEPSAIKEIRAESGQIAWESSEGHVDFEIELSSGQSRTVSIRFHDLSGNGRYRENAGYKVKAMLRRYLCEVRDNYIVPAKFKFAGSR